ncbi:MAG: antibiotic biosynthesis monooxygenase [Gammaproteobacteria bacterium]
MRFDTYIPGLFESASEVANIDSEAEGVTLINVFTVEPTRQAELVALLDEATAQVMRHQRGFVSASIHKSLDGRKVANYAQWHSKEDFDAMLKIPECQQHIAKAAALAERFEPELYAVAAVHDRPGAGGRFAYSPDLFISL